MIRGKLVALRPYEEGDIAALQAIDSDPVVRTGVVGWDWPRSRREISAWYDEQAGGPNRRWIIEDDHAQIVGVTGLWDVDWHNRNALTGIKLGGAVGARGNGFGIDAIKLTMAFAFYDVGLERLYASALETNAASIHVYCNRCGWTQEGRSRNHIWRGGSFVDLIHMGIQKSEFDALSDAHDYQNIVTSGRAS